MHSWLAEGTTYELASRKASTERIDGLQGFCRLHGVRPMLAHDVDQQPDQYASGAGGN